jgi:hypothetical protein
VLTYDAEWLAVLHGTQHLHSSVRAKLPLDPSAIAAASGGRNTFTPTDEELRAVSERAAAHLAKVGDACSLLGAQAAEEEAAEAVAQLDTPADAAARADPLAVPLNFTITAPPYVDGESLHVNQLPLIESPQTAAFVATFGLEPDWRVQRGATLGAAAHAAPPADAPRPHAYAPQHPPPQHPPLQHAPQQHAPQQHAPPPLPPAYGYYGDPAGYAPPPYGSLPPAPFGAPPPPFGAPPPPPPPYGSLPPPPYGAPPYGAPPPPPPHGAQPPTAPGGMFAPMILDEEISLDDEDD